VIVAAAKSIASGPNTAAANNMTIDGEDIVFTCHALPFPVHHMDQPSCEPAGLRGAPIRLA
jgi:hypothetical protein